MGMDLGMIIRCNYSTAGLLCLLSVVWTRGDTKGHDLEGGPQPECENWLWVSSLYGNYGLRALCAWQLWRFMWLKTPKAMEKSYLKKVASADSL